MIWTFIIGIMAIVIIRFLWDLNKDNYDLEGKSLVEKFEILIELINNAAFNGNGTITTLDKRSFNLYETGQNQIINFQYSTGHLTITWKYKYFQKEIKHEKQFDNVRNLSIFEQQKIAEIMIKEMTMVVAHHKLNVLGN